MHPSIMSILALLLMFTNIRNTFGNSMVPVLTLDSERKITVTIKNGSKEPLQYLPFIMLIDKNKDTSEYWRETEILSLVNKNEANIDYEKCEMSNPSTTLVHFPSRRTVRPICRDRIEPLASRRRLKTPCSCNDYPPETFKHKNRTYIHRHKCSCLKRRKIEVTTTRRRKNKQFIVKEDEIEIDFTETNHQLCPQCPHFSNFTECELFRDSCKERKVLPGEHRTYCDRKYGKWRTMFIPADYKQCRCCDECVFYREMDQSCMEDDYSFDAEEYLPVTTIDFRAGCNPYWGHPEQEYRALRCDKILRRCVPVTVPALPNETLHLRRSFRYEPPTGGLDCPISCRGYDCFGGLVNERLCQRGAFLPDRDQCNCCGTCSAYQRGLDCPISCRGYDCFGGLVNEHLCQRGAFLPDRDQCNCCGTCSAYQQLNQKCAEFKKTVHNVNGTKEIEVEEEFLEPGCDDGLVCRQGRCQDIHTVQTTASSRRKRDEGGLDANEPCKRELKYFKKKYGPDGHLHFEAPQCTPLWLYAPVQCRRFVCYCALEDGSIIQGIKVPRVEVSNMNCDCAREKCRTESDVECDGFGNYKEAVFTPHVEDWQWRDADDMEDEAEGSVARLEAPLRTTFDSLRNPTTLGSN